jgi:hypothetical protein
VAAAVPAVQATVVKATETGTAMAMVPATAMARAIAEEIDPRLNWLTAPVPAFRQTPIAGQLATEFVFIA